MKIKNVRSFLVLFGAIFFAAGMSFFWAGVIHTFSFNTFKSNAETVLAEITYIDFRSARGDSSTSTDVRVSYTVDGQQYEKKLNYYTTGMHVGDTIEIYVDPENPSKIKVGTVLADVIFMLVGGVFAFVGGCIMAVNAAKILQKKRLIRDGERLSAIVTNVYMDNNVRINGRLRINGRHPYKVECEFTDPYSGERYLFSSDIVTDDISYMVGYSVTVYADRDDRSKYYVDIGGLTEQYNEENKIHDYR